MTKTLICLDSVFEHDPKTTRIRRLAGDPTPLTTGTWTTVLELRAAKLKTYPTTFTDEPPRPGHRLLIRRTEAWTDSTDSTALVLTTSVAPSGRWRPGPTDRTVLGPHGQTLIVPQVHPTSTVGIAAILDVAEQLPDPAHADVIADWYWPTSTVQDIPVITDRSSGTPLLAATDPETIRTATTLLARHPIASLADVICALLGASEWEVGPSAIHSADDGQVTTQLEQAGWPPEHLATISPRARRELLFDAAVIEQSGIPWPLIHTSLHTGEA